MKATRARLHADDGQELWNVMEGVRLSIQILGSVTFPSLIWFLLQQHSLVFYLLHCFIAATFLYKWNSSAFFSFLCRHYLADSLSLTNYLSLHPLNTAHFHQHGTLFFSADESDFARSLVPETLFRHQISKPREANSLSIELNSRWKETNPLSQKDSEARFHELQFIRWNIVEYL